MKRPPELLAPAGSLDAVIAAVRCGADAVYFGAKEFNARRNADNFGDEELETAIRYCHARGVKVHLTLNTLVSDEELPAAMKLLRHVCALGADVLILQDLGLAELARRCAPDLVRHASTQMSVQTPQGAALLKELGFSRVVLPRELCKEEIASFAKQTDLEAEVFIHGAQCMCVSGQCYLSAMLGSRSGNRGLCAQPCRLQFSADDTPRHDLSLKDLSLMERLDDLAALGVDSFKIEGRMKRPEYVAAAVTAARQAMSGEPDPAMLQTLQAVFSRSGFSSGYFDGARGSAMFGVRRKEDVTAATGKVLASLAKLYDQEPGRIGVAFSCSILRGKAPVLTAEAAGRTVSVTGEILPEEARQKPLTRETLQMRLSKCGGTPFFAQAIEIELDEGLILPASEINALRRRALETLENALSAVKQIAFTETDFSTYFSEKKKNAAPAAAARGETQKLPGFSVRVAHGGQIPRDISNVENLYLPLDFDEKSVESVKNKGISLGVEIPRGIFGAAGIVEKQLRRAKEFGIQTALCSTLDAVSLAKQAGMDVHGGFGLNIFNSASAAVLESLDVKAFTLSPELTLTQAERLQTRLGKMLFAYGRLPLMLTRNCPIRNVKTCAQCGGASFLTDRMGVRFPVVCRLGCSEVLNSRPIYLADRLHEVRGVDTLLFWFTGESRETADAVLQAYRTKKAVQGAFTRGLCYRGVE